MKGRANAPVGPGEAPPARSLWFGLLAAPVAWSLHDMLSAFFATTMCADGEVALGALGPGGARALLATILVLALAGAIAGWIVALRSWRSLGTGERPTRSDTRTWPELMAAGGVLVSALSLVGLLYGGLPVFLLDVCASFR